MEEELSINVESTVSMWSNGGKGMVSLHSTIHWVHLGLFQAEQQIIELEQTLAFYT